MECRRCLPDESASGLEQCGGRGGRPAHNLALRNDGTVVAWGGYYSYSNNNEYYVRMTVPGDLTNAVAIASGDSHALALRSDGMVVVWGDNS